MTRSWKDLPKMEWIDLKTSQVKMKETSTPLDKPSIPWPRKIKLPRLPNPEILCSRLPKNLLCVSTKMALLDPSATPLPCKTASTPTRINGKGMEIPAIWRSTRSMVKQLGESVLCPTTANQTWKPWLQFKDRLSTTTGMLRCKSSGSLLSNFSNKWQWTVRRWQKLLPLQLKLSCKTTSTWRRRTWSPLVANLDAPVDALVTHKHMPDALKDSCPWTCSGSRSNVAATRALMSRWSETEERQKTKDISKMSEKTWFDTPYYNFYFHLLSGAYI